MLAAKTRLLRQWCDCSVGALTQGSQVSDKVVHHPADLLRELEAEHVNDFVYRGESRVFPAPIWPSKYRRYFASERGVEFERSLRLRGEGACFYFRANFLRDPLGGRDQRTYEEILQREQVRKICMDHVRNALGYPLAEAMFQQAGWSSEGVDVTVDARVALRFALTIWGEDGGKLLPRAEPAVIYRWKVEPRQWTFNDLRAYDYYSCPTYVPTREICRLFRMGSSQEFYDSLNNYRQAIGWDCLSFDLGNVQNKRPFELICLPNHWRTKSRVERQAAALLLPDSCRREALPSIAQEYELGMMAPDALDTERRRLSVKDCLAHGTFG
jgi:hypothetical protein